MDAESLRSPEGAEERGVGYAEGERAGWACVVGGRRGDDGGEQRVTGGADGAGFLFEVVELLLQFLNK